MATKLREQVYRQYKELGLTRGEMSILACIADRARPDGTASFPGKERIMRETGYCRRWVMIILRRLEVKGCIKPVSLLGGRGNKTSYHIPLNQFGRIIPEPLSAPDEPFLDVDDQAAASSSPAIPETPRPGRLVEAPPGNYRDGYTPRNLPAVRVEELSLEQLIKLAEAKVAKMNQIGGSIGRRMLDQAKAELLELQQRQQGGYVT